MSDTMWVESSTRRFSDRQRSFKCVNRTDFVVLSLLGLERLSLFLLFYYAMLE